MPRPLSFEYILTPQGLERGRKLLLDDSGRIASIESGVAPWDGMLAIPGMPNAHSHCFQRALAGVRESATADSFWSWRETMYRVANALEPDDLYVVALRAFGDMLAAGFTSVGEFHYLFHPRGTAPAGARAQNFEMVDAVRRAAADAGIRLTMLPVFYQRGGFGLPANPGQSRFLHDSLEEFARLLEHLSDGPCGVAPHSLRAVPLELLPRLVAVTNQVLGTDSPIHIHISEQRREVEECLAYYDRTPIQCLVDTVELNERWNLVHATHAQQAELELMHARGANLVLCPLTEAYLGDGVFPLADWAARGGRFAIGSDSNARIDAIEELRLAEFGQRLTLQRRAVLGDQGRLGGAQGLGAGLWNAAAEVGAHSLAQPAGAIAPGHFADLVVLDFAAPLFAGVPPEHCLDAWLIGGSSAQIAGVYIDGKLRVEHGHCPLPAAARRFAAVMQRIHG